MRHHGFLHVNLNVIDLARSVRFYTQALGFTVICESSETADLGSGDETIQQQGTRHQGGESEAFSYVRDPDGYALELSTQAILYTRFP